MHSAANAVVNLVNLQAIPAFTPQPQSIIAL